MSTTPEPEIILYDLACTKNVCFSPTVWRVRLMLKYKSIPYKTVFLEFPDIEPTLKNLGVAPSSGKYTVPTIHHLPTSTYLMDSIAISLFLDTTYPLPALSPSSDAIETRARTALGPAFRISLMPREIHILSPRSAEYFRRTREEMLGCKLEEVGSGGKEEEAWKGVEGEMKAVGEMLVRDKEERAGKGPSMTDFFVAGSMETARVVDEAVFERMVGVKGFKEVYEGCAEWMDRRD